MPELRRLPLLWAASLIMLLFLTGCTKQFARVNFCWSSDFHLDPDSRMVETGKSVPEVEKMLAEWIRQRGGTVLEQKSEELGPIIITEENRKNFATAKELSQNEWAAYQENNFDKTPSPEDFKLMKEAVLATRTFAPGKTAATTVTALFTDKQRQFSFTRQTGVDVGKSFSLGLLTGRTYFKTEKHSFALASKINFIIFNTDGKTKVYATGRPIDTSTNIQADFGKAIGHSWWRYVTGTEEAMLVMDALEALKQ